MAMRYIFDKHTLKTKNERNERNKSLFWKWEIILMMHGVPSYLMLDDWYIYDTIEIDLEVTIYSSFFYLMIRSCNYRKSLL